MQEHDAKTIQSVVFEMAQLGVKVIPFDDGKSINDYMEMFPEHEYFAFSHRSVEDIADLYDKMMYWISPDRDFSPDQVHGVIIMLKAILEEKIISSKRYDILSSAIQTKSQQPRDTNA